MVKLMCGMLIWLPCEVPVTWMHQAHFGMCEEVKIIESRTLHCTRHSLLSDQFLSHPILRIVLLLQNMQASEAWFQSTCADPFCMNALLISRTWTSLPSALRPQSILTFLSLLGQPPVGVFFCGTKSHLVEKLLKTFCFWTFILTTRKRIIISDKVSGWFQFLDLTDGSISWWTILCVVFVLSWSWLKSLLKDISQLSRMGLSNALTVATASGTLVSK